MYLTTPNTIIETTVNKKGLTHLQRPVSSDVMFDGSRNHRSVSSSVTKTSTETSSESGPPPQNRDKVQPILSSRPDPGEFYRAPRLLHRSRSPGPTCEPLEPKEYRTTSVLVLQVPCPSPLPEGIRTVPNSV